MSSVICQELTMLIKQIHSNFKIVNNIVYTFNSSSTLRVSLHRCAISRPPTHKSKYQYRFNKMFNRLTRSTTTHSSSAAWLVQSFTIGCASIYRYSCAILAPSLIVHSTRSLPCILCHARPLSRSTLIPSHFPIAKFPHSSSPLSSFPRPSFLTSS